MYRPATPLPRWRAFDDLSALLDKGTRLQATTAEHERVIARALAKLAPFHRPRNSVADALLIELLATAASKGAGPHHRFEFVTSNAKDFSTTQGDERLPHDDFRDIFTPMHSGYRLGVEGLEQALLDDFGDDFLDLVNNGRYWSEEPRRLDVILTAEQEMFDRIWCDRSILHEDQLNDAGKHDEVDHLRQVAGPGRARVEATYGIENLGPYDKVRVGNAEAFGPPLGLGSEWDFLDT